MFSKILFFIVVAYFLYQLYLSFREKNISKRVTGLAVGVTILLVTLSSWPVYLNIHLVFSLLTFLYGVGMFYESIRQKKGFYFLTAIILFVLSGIQFVEYLDIT